MLGIVSIITAYNTVNVSFAGDCAKTHLLGENGDIIMILKVEG